LKFYGSTIPPPVRSAHSTSVQSTENHANLLKSYIVKTFSHRVNSSKLLVLFALCVLPLAAQQPLQTLLVGVDHRNVVSLDGDWHYLIDQSPAPALYNRKGEVRDNSYAMNTHPTIVGPHNDEYDFATAPTLKVPGDWNTQIPQLFNYEGVVWYQRDFDFQPKAGTRTFLHIGAANHEGGYTPFDCEATAVLHPGSNFVVIAVDATRLRNGIPGVEIDWLNYGGLTRDVSLVIVPAAVIDDYDVHLVHGPAWQPGNTDLTGYVHVLDARAGTPVTLDIPEAGVHATIQTGADGTASFSVKAASLTLWSPASPKLYKVTLSSGSDSLTDDIGFRDIRVEGTHILLNGKPIFLQGVSMHAEAPIRGGRIDNDRDVATVFGYLKDMNANFVRLAHYPHDERMERTADRDGIMIWSEIPLWQNIAFADPEVYPKASHMLNEMIRRDRNKASVILWSVSNETPNNATRTQFLTDIVAEARKLDPTRPITSALDTQKVEGHSGTMPDPFADVLDVIGINEYIGWYGGTPEDAAKTTWTLPQKPLIMSEFGAEAKQGNHGATDQRWTEEQQVYFYQRQFTMLNHIPQLRGTSPWILMDFRSPIRNIPLLQDGYNRKGLISNEGVKKQAFYLFQKAYQDRAIGKPE
jgi:beta-glucuronidase